MRAFLWTSGHFSWAFVAIVVFTGLLLLLTDLYWRLKATKLNALLFMVAASWIIGTGLILVCCYFANG